MDETRKPRHIRDIAHLYLSRLPAKRDRNTTRLWVMAVSRECFSSYHAANLALGISRKGHTVDLVEVSGLIPCAAYFLQLPPRVYIKHKTQSPEEPLSALGGITVRFALENRTEARKVISSGISAGASSRQSSLVEVIHFPPVSEFESLRSSLARASDSALGDDFSALVLAPTDSQARDAGRRIWAGKPAVRWSTLSLERRFTTGEQTSSDVRSLGYLVGWRQLLADPVPCVLRDPESHVSRSYLSVCDVLVREGSVKKERNDSKPSRSTRSGASLGQFR